MVFLSVALGLLVLEMVVWWTISAKKPRLQQLTHRVNGIFDRYIAIHFRDQRFLVLVARASRALCRQLMLALFAAGGYVGSGICSFLPRRWKELFSVLREHWRDLDALGKLDRVVFRPIEALNSCWLVFIILAQTLGVWQRCECVTSSWGGENYMDLSQFKFTTSKFVNAYWITGTVTSVSFMGVAILYIVVEWCGQSHLSTADLRKAANGLKRTRRFRVWMTPLRWITWKICRWGRATTLKWSRHQTLQVPHPDRSETLRMEGGTRSGPMHDQSGGSTELQVLGADPHDLDSGTEKPSSSPSPKPSTSRDPSPER